MFKKRKAALMFVGMMVIALVVVAALGMGKPAGAAPSDAPLNLGAGQGCNETITNPTGWTYYWGDEFADGTIDGSKWEVLSGQDGLNSDISYNQTANVTESGGMLQIKLQKRADGNYFTGGIYNNYWANYYDAGKVTTKNRFNLTYGRVEVCGKPPAGSGFHTSYWLLHNDTNVSVSEGGSSGPWPPEIDITEVLGRSDKNTLDFTTWHYLDGGGNHVGAGAWPQHTEGLSNAFHLYAVEWTSTEIRWYFDGEQVFSTTASISQSNVPMKLVLDTEVGSIWWDDGWAHLPDGSTPDTAYNQIKYVRVYQAGSATPTNTPVGPTPTRTATPVATNTPVQGNLIANPGFESDWANWDDSTGGTTTIITSDKHGGSKAAQLAPWSWRAENVTMLPNTSYTISGWGKRTVGTALCSWAINSDVTFTNGGVSFTSSSWTFQTSTFTTPASWGWAMTEIYADNSTCLFDDLNLTANSGPTPTPTRTNTPVGPTSTFTRTPTKTNTPTKTPTPTRTRTPTNTPIPVNLVLNPGFESNWTNWDDSTGGTTSLNTSDKHGGSKSAQLAPWSWRAENASLLPNTSYTISGWGKRSAGTALCSWAINSDVTFTNGGVSFTSTSWTFQTSTFTTPASWGWAMTEIYADNSTCLFDDLSLVKN